MIDIICSFLMGLAIGKYWLSENEDEKSISLPRSQKIPPKPNPKPNC